MPWTTSDKIAIGALGVSVISLIGTGVISCWSLLESHEGLRVSKETLQREYLEAPSLTISLGQNAFLASKPYVGVMISAYNSGAQTGVVAHGTLKFDTNDLNLVMMSPQADSWTYGPKRDEIPMRFSFFAPLTIGKSASVSSVIWFEKDMGGSRLFTAGNHSLELQLFNDIDPKPAATKKFELNLTPDNISFIYNPKNQSTQLPVSVTYKPRIVSGAPQIPEAVN